MSGRTAVIIGGGVIGLSTAYQLALRKYGRIVLLEKNRVGDGSSSRAAGITTGLLWSETGVNARKISVQLFKELSHTLPDYRYHDEHGCLNLFTPELWPARESLLPLYDRLQAPYQVLSAAQIHQRWPALTPPDDYIGLHDPRGGYSEPPDYIRSLAQTVRALGVEVYENEKVIDWVVREGRLRGVTTTRATYEADAVVSTVYAWTLPLLRPLGIQPPVKSFVHQRYLSAPLPSPLSFPPVNADPLGGYVRPAFGNRILMGVETAERDEHRVHSSDFVMTELAAPAGLRDETAVHFCRLLPKIADAKWESERVGLISFSMDGEPVLGPVAAMPGLFVGVAFHSGGFSYNPVAGLLLAQYVADGKTAIDVQAFSPNRFDLKLAASYVAETVKQKNAVKRRH